MMRAMPEPQRHTEAPRRSGVRAPSRAGGPQPPSRLQRVEAIFFELLDQPAELRQAHLDQRCGTDRTLRLDVERLLRADSRGPEFLAAPAMGEGFTLPEPANISEGSPPRRVG